MNKKKIVVVGGGTGTYTVLRGLRRFGSDVDISAVVSMADSGGSTGRLRDDFGFLPIGDVRSALTALASENEEDSILLRQLFMYRFAQGNGLGGHNFGNLFLTALTDILGSEVLAISAASRILKVAGKVIPVTVDKVHLTATYENGQTIIGEHEIEEAFLEDNASRIVSLGLTPLARLNPEAKEAIESADLLVFGPGDLYTSILANCVVDGFKEAVAVSQARFVYVCNLMSRLGQTVGMHASEHLQEVTLYSGRVPDVMLLNNAPLREDLLLKYHAEGNHSVLNNCDNDTCTIYELPLVSEEEVILQNGDVLRRSLIRHDSLALGEALMSLI